MTLDIERPVAPASAAQAHSYRDALYQVLAANPKREVIHEKTEVIMASDFLDRVAIMAAWMEDNIARNDRAPLRVGLALHDNVWSFSAMMACWFTDLVPVLIDHRISVPDLQDLVARNDLRCVITRQARLTSGDATVLMLPEPATLLADAEHLRHARGRLAVAAETPANGTDVAGLHSSSGVTGPPKLYPVTQSRLLDIARGAATDGQRGQWGSALSVLSISFGAARLVWLRNLLFGKSIHTLPLLFSIADLDTALRDPRIEECSLPPNLLRALLQHADRFPGPEPRYPHLAKLQSVGGPALPADKLAAQARLSDQYLMTFSSTETGVISRIEGEDLRRKPDSCGRPISPDDMRIVDAAGQTLPAGAIGRICVMVTRTTAGTAQKEPAWPGDLGWLDEDGFLYVAARGDGIICRNGVNYSAQSVETRLLTIPEVLDAAVLRIAGSAGDDETLIAVRLTPFHSADIGRSLRKCLSAHEQPQAFVVANDDDVTAGGKIRRQALLQRYRDAPLSLQML